MVSKHFVFLLLVAGLFLAGCVQPAAPADSPSALPTVTAPAAPTATPGAAATVNASASPTARVPYIPSAKPTTLPESTPVATEAPAGVPTLAEFVKDFNQATNAAFNDSRKAYESATDIWVVDDTQAEFKYTIFMKLARARSFGAFDTVRQVTGAKGTVKNVSLTESESGPFYKYALVMKCYDARYDVELTLWDFVRMSGNAQYRRTLGSSVMQTLADACPN